VIRYLAGRLVWSVVTVWFIVSVTFAMITAIPADPARIMLGPHASPEAVARVRAEYCFDRSWIEQYGCYVVRLAQGDLGQSFRSRRPVDEIIASRVWPTTQLALAAIALQLLIGLPLGVWAAVRRGRWADHGANLVALIGQSAPTFFTGTILLWLIAYRTGWFPIGGYGEGVGERLLHLVLPAFTLASVGIAFYARVVRNEMIDVLAEDYVRTARAKGLPERRVVLRHGLRNALGPVATLVGLDLGVLMGGAVVTEYLFAWPGLGREVLQAILEIDIPLILGVVLFTAVVIVVVNLIVDIAYGWLDPRVRIR
jgi:peptide/nickel transport system permease protein